MIALEDRQQMAEWIAHAQVAGAWLAPARQLLGLADSSPNRNTLPDSM